MPQQLVTRAKFARLANRNASAITRAASGPLKDAMVGRWVDANHPAALEYLETRTGGGVNSDETATGIDRLYQRAVEVLIDHGRFSRKHLKAALQIGSQRADRLIQLIKAAGVDITVPQVEMPLLLSRKPGGHGAHKESQKRAATIDQRHHEIPANIQSLADRTLREIIEEYGSDYQFVDFLTALQKIEKAHETRLKNMKFEGMLIERTLVKTHVIDTFNTAHINLLGDGSKSIARECLTMAQAKEELSAIELYVESAITKFIKPIKNKVSRALREI